MQSAQALGHLGFRIVIFPGGTARAVAHSLQGYFTSLLQNGTTQPWRGQMLDFDQLNEVIGTPTMLKQGKQYDLSK